MRIARPLNDRIRVLHSYSPLVNTLGLRARAKQPLIIIKTPEQFNVVGEALHHPLGGCIKIHIGNLSYEEEAADVRRTTELPTGDQVLLDALAPQGDE